MSGPFNIQPTPIFMDIPTHKKLSSLNIFLILFDYLARKVVVLENLFSSCLWEWTWFHLADVNEKKLISISPCAFLPNGALNWVAFISFILIEVAHSYSSQLHLIFDTHDMLEGSKNSVQPFLFSISGEKKSHSRSVSSSFFHSLPSQAQTEEGRNTW